MFQDFYLVVITCILLIVSYRYLNENLWVYRRQFVDYLTDGRITKLEEKNHVETFSPFGGNGGNINGLDFALYDPGPLPLPLPPPLPNFVQAGSSRYAYHSGYDPLSPSWHVDQPVGLIKVLDVKKETTEVVEKKVEPIAEPVVVVVTEPVAEPVAVVVPEPEPTVSVVLKPVD